MSKQDRKIAQLLELFDILRKQVESNSRSINLLAEGLDVLHSEIKLLREQGINHDQPKNSS